MDSRGGRFVCLFYVLVNCGVLGNEGHGSICSQNERFLSCGGCQKTCKDPAPDCQSVCRIGCYCNEDEVRNDTGHCVKLADCPPVELSSLQSSEPRHSDTECPADEEYRYCEPCIRTCDNPNPICPAQCARGCFCRDDLVRDSNGRCIKKENCSNWKKKDTSNFIKPIEYQLICGAHQVYSSCRSCEKTCSSPIPECSPTCSAGCFCEDGYLKAPSGKCVKLEDCPKAEVSIGDAHEPSIEDCSSDEIYLSCGWCEPSCSEPRPECPRGVCTRGCLCRPPLLRHFSGHCVLEENCSTQKCPDPNEEYICRYGCEARCKAIPCTSRPRRCVLGCHCKLGLLRDSNWQCVTPENCFNGEGNISKLNNKDNDSFSGIDSTKYTKNRHPRISLAEFSDSQSVFDAEASKTQIKPYKDVMSRAVKLYKDLVNNEDSNYKDFYVPRSFKNSPMSRSYKDSSGFAKESLMVKDDPVPDITIYSGYNDVNVKNYMQGIFSAIKEIMPPMIFNFTIV